LPLGTDDGRAPQKPSPWGEGGWPLGQTDEGADFGLGSLYAGGLSPPAGGEFLSQRWERNQRIAGGRGRRALRAHRTAYPRSPITGVTPLAWRWIFGAQNLSGLLPFNPGHWAMGVQKFRTNAVPQPRL